MRHAEGRPGIRIDVAAGDGNGDKLLRTIFTAVFLIEQVNVEAEVLRSRKIVRIGLHATNNLEKRLTFCVRTDENATAYFTEHNAKRENVHSFVVALTFEHLRCHLQSEQIVETMHTKGLHLTQYGDPTTVYLKQWWSSFPCREPTLLPLPIA